MSKKPKLRKKNAYQILSGCYPLFETFADAECSAGDSVFSWTMKRHPRGATPADDSLKPEDIFILLSMKHNGRGTAYMKVIPPSGRIAWIYVVDRTYLQLVFSHLKPR
jgi:hypothetical protein